jgi:Arc/MetJ family transcription regulator
MFFEVAQEVNKQGHHVTLVCSDKASNKNIEVDDLLFVRVS